LLRRRREREPDEYESERDAVSNLKKIRDFWEERGMAAPFGELATHRDREQVKLEIETVLELLKPSDRLLDIGCGNGFSTAGCAQKCQTAVGLDFSNQMIETAEIDALVLEHFILVKAEQTPAAYDTSWREEFVLD
jgi:cyclopropane fatty-acyl-phospholipid synthase-like methyltransferase